MVMWPSTKLDLWERVFSQVQGVDYDENFSPVAMLKSVGIMIALAVFFDYEILQMDVKTSFLTSFVRKVVCDTIKGFVDPKDAKRYAGSSNPSMD